MKILLTHPGTQHSFQLARQLYKRGLLYEFHTGVAFGKDSLYYRLFSRMPGFIFHKLSNRFIDEVPDRLIKRNPFIELKALLRLKLGQDEEVVLYNRNKRFQSGISDDAIKKADAVIGFDTSSWILAKRCRNLDRHFFLDVSIAHPVAKDLVYRRIIKLYPNWRFSVKSKDYNHIAIEETEMELAGHIVVASSFTLKTYAEHEVPVEKISINPYGVDTSGFTPAAVKHNGKEEVHFVFVGSVDARKGIPFLLETWDKMETGNARLTLVGPVSEFTKAYIQKHYPEVTVMGKLPFSELKKALPGFDVMIFPSFFEGYGLVVPEAMACGLPVITTNATCGPDIIEHGNEGFIIEPAAEEPLKKAIAYFISNPGAVVSMGGRARAKAETLSWDAYGERWKQILERVLYEK